MIRQYCDGKNDCANKGDEQYCWLLHAAKDPPAIDAFGRYKTDASGYLMKVVVGKFVVHCGSQKKYSPDETKHLVSLNVLKIFSEQIKTKINCDGTKET